MPELYSLECKHTHCVSVVLFVCTGLSNPAQLTTNQICTPPDVTNRAGKTPLSIAYSNRHLETVKYLVQEHQCNPNCIFWSFFCSANKICFFIPPTVVVNKHGDTPLSIECSRGHLDWVKALINKHIDPRSK